MIFIISFFLFSSLNIQPLTGQTPEKPPILVGAEKIKITPTVETFTDQNKNGRYDPHEPFEDINQNKQWDPLWLAGYHPGRFSTGIQDDLWVRSLVISMDQTTILFVSLDLVGYLFDEVSLTKKEIVEKLQIPDSHIFIASTHNHSGPDTIGLWGETSKISGKDPVYLKLVREKIVECSKKAIENRQPAQIYFGKGRLPKLIKDSRPPKVINDLLLSLRADNFKGETIATLVNYALHPEVMDEKNRLVTPDFPGYLRDRLEEHFGGTSLFFVGDIGGMQTPKVFYRSFSKCEKFGKKIAEKLIHSLEEQSPIPIDTILVKSSEILFPIENRRFLDAIENGPLKEIKQSTKKIGAEIFLPSQIALIELGSAQFVTVPGELFPELGDLIRKEMEGEYKFFIGLCNNEIGYIIPKEEWKEGGYEESMSLGIKTGDIFRDAISKLLKN